VVYKEQMQNHILYTALSYMYIKFCIDFDPASFLYIPVFKNTMGMYCLNKKIVMLHILCICISNVCKQQKQYTISGKFGRGHPVA